VLALLVVAVLALALLAAALPDKVPLAVLLLPIMWAGWRLSRRSVVVLGGVVLLVVVLAVSLVPLGRVWVSSGVVVLGLGLAYRYAQLRERWGLSATQGLGILLDLRDGLRQQGDLVPPPGWTVGRALRSAGGAGMRGDFSVALVTEGWLQVVLVDVSGHGPDVAARASQLSGAFGGLIGAVPADRLLPACNAYVCRQHWQHTYATAIHLCVDTTTGRAQVRSAGHPAAQVRRADGSWEAVQATGPLLGLVAEPSFAAVDLALLRGDTAMLLSDGLLDPATDEPYPQLTAGVSGWAAQASGDVDARLIADVPVQVEDDQSIVLVRRDGVGQDGAHGT
jgi:hypothetical protein